MNRIAILFLALINAAVANPVNELEKNFAAPPHEAKPWVYWWFQGGFGDPNGMALDLAAMKQQGIGGVMHMQTINMGGLPLPKEPKMLSPEWEGWFGEALRLAHESGLTMSASIVDGWAHGGGWVGKEEGAKQLVYSEMQFEGPGAIGGSLPMPPTRLGVYHDVAVVAFRGKATRPPVPVRIRGSDVMAGYCKQEYWPAVHAADMDPNTYVSMKGPASVEKPQWIEVTYLSPIAATGALILNIPKAGMEVGAIEVSDDGKTFRQVIPVAMTPGESKRVSFPAVTARTFRLLVTKAHVPDLQIAEFQLLRQGDEPVLRPGIKYWELKSANFGGGWGGWPKDLYQALEEDYTDPEAADVAANEVVDLSSHLKEDGSLDWRFPAGRWTVLRFGWTPLAEPARRSNNGGYEVDVLDTVGADLMMDQAAKRMRDLSVKHAQGAPIYFHTDSWEIGAGNKGQQPTWTTDFREQFSKRRGYDPVQYLPAMARKVIGSRQITERFLNDYRTTVADLLAAYYGRLQERAHEMQGGMNCESGYGSFPHPHMDGLQIFGRSDRPMAEFWHPYGGYASSYLQQVDVMRTAASGARTYGNRFVQAETLTFDGTRGLFIPPQDYRKTLHAAWARGLNQAVIHKYTHQSLEVKPGLMDYDIFNRHFSWWPLADGFLGYIGRCQYLLQQGDLVTDCAYFVGEGASRFVPGKAFLKPALPPSSDYDGINAEVLMTRVQVKDGRLVLPSIAGAPGVEPGMGPSYRYLVLCDPQCTTMTVATMARIRKLVADGLTLVGKRPVRTPGLHDWQAADQELKKHADVLWGEHPGERGMKTVGEGRVIWGTELGELFKQDGVLPDVEYQALGKTDKSPNLEFLHRSVANKDIVFLANQSGRAVDLAITIRTRGLQVSLFDPLDGSTRELPEQKREADHRLTVPLHFEKDQALFLVAQDVSPATLAGRNIPVYTEITIIPGPWKVSFDAAWVKPLPPGAAADAQEVFLQFDRLEDWSKRPEVGIASYSGMGIYRTEFKLPAGTDPNQPTVLNLGTVNEMARVELNGRDLGVVWCAPWRVTIPKGVLTGGNNSLVIRVANLWTNRLAVDASLPEKERLTQASQEVYRRAVQVTQRGQQASGLLGPVRLESVK